MKSGCCLSVVRGLLQSYLSILSNGKVERLCDFGRIGRLEGAFITTSGEKAFLLAGIGGQLDVWMTALPARATK